jgi:hypothetical protein
MVTLLLLLPSIKVLAGILALHALWWGLADAVLEHVGIPLLDAGCVVANDSDMRGRSTIEGGNDTWRR